MQYDKSQPVVDDESALIGGDDLVVVQDFGRPLLLRLVEDLGCAVPIYGVDPLVTLDEILVAIDDPLGNGVAG